MKRCLFICFVVVYFCCLTIDGEDQFKKNFYKQTIAEVDKIRYKYGSDVRLKCPLHHRRHSNNQSLVTWQLKTCDVVGYYENCQWKKINSKSKKSLEIRNFTRQNVGEYRCYQGELLRKTFVLDIVNDVIGGTPPEVLSFEATNLTIEENGATILQCKVKSYDAPEVMWFRDCYSYPYTSYTDRTSCNKFKIEKTNYCYCLINVIRPVPLMKNEYLSKLRISQAASIDSGMYSCLVWNVHGIDFKNLTINVLGKNMPLRHYSISWLFVLPLLFFSVLMTVWLCCFKRKKRKLVKDNIIIGQQNKLIHPEVQFCLIEDPSVSGFV